MISVAPSELWQAAHAAKDAGGAAFAFVVVFLILGYLGTRDIATWRARLCTIVYFLFFILMPWYTTRDKVKPVPERVTGV